MKINDIRTAYGAFESEVEEILTRENPLGFDAGEDYESEAAEIAERLVAGSAPANEKEEYDVSTVEDCVFAVFASNYGREVEQGDLIWFGIAKKIMALT